MWTQYSVIVERFKRGWYWLCPVLLLRSIVVLKKMMRARYLVLVEHYKREWYWRCPLLLLPMLVLLNPFDILSFPSSIPSPPVQEYRPVAEVDPASTYVDFTVNDQLKGVWEVRERWVAGLPLRSAAVVIPWQQPERSFLFIDGEALYTVIYDAALEQQWGLFETEHPIFNCHGPGTMDVFRFNTQTRCQQWHLCVGRYQLGRWKYVNGKLTIALEHNGGLHGPHVRPEMTDKPGEGVWLVLERVDREHEPLPVYDIDPKTLPKYTGYPHDPNDYFHHSRTHIRSDHPGFRAGTISSKADLGQLPESLRHEIETAFERPKRTPEPPISKDDP